MADTPTQTPPNIVVHLNGWPGVGKLTIGRALARRLGARLMDNHTLLNPAEALFKRNDPNWLALRKEIRGIVFSYMARIEIPAPIILTDALADDDWDRGWFEDCRQLAVDRSARLVSVILDCAAEENTRRLQAAGRSESRKLTDPGVLADLQARYRLLRPDGIDIIELEVTSLAPEIVAEKIEAMLPTA